MITINIGLVVLRLFSFQSNPKNLDPSSKMDLDLWDCLRRVKLVSIAKFHRTGLVICRTGLVICRTGLVICSHSNEGKNLSYRQVNVV